VDVAAIFGSWAAGNPDPDSDIDLLIIGRPDMDAIEGAARDVERLSGREVNVVVYEPEDWLSRVRSGSGFASAVLDRPLIELVGRIPR
jgi:predicted nucleotidyltransferase